MASIVSIVIDHTLLFSNFAEVLVSVAHQHNSHVVGGLAEADNNQSYGKMVK